MPDKLTDKEIVKALRSWLEEIRKSRQAYLEKVNEEHYPSMRYEYLLSDTIHEINRLQAENERLQEMLQALYTAVPIGNNKKFANELQKIKAEAYKECIEKVKEEIYRQRHSRSLEASGERARIIKIFDNLLKELVVIQPPLNDVKCKDCEYLELELPYAVCSKAYKGIVAPDDSCGKGKLKELVGGDNAKEKE